MLGDEERKRGGEREGRWVREEEERGDGAEGDDGASVSRSEARCDRIHGASSDAAPLQQRGASGRSSALVHSGRVVRSGAQRAAPAPSLSPQPRSTTLLSLPVAASTLAVITWSMMLRKRRRKGRKWGGLSPPPPPTPPHHSPSAIIGIWYGWSRR